MILALIVITCLNAVMFFYILDLKEILKEYEDEICELNKFLHDETNG
jgi:hypothetical protein